ncbi:MAG TPA: hypothetical protein VFK20_07610 [Vicinamibacterales bacterium]|nr:hypothetical protein [Vicinamibacterales bacterium]
MTRRMWTAALLLALAAPVQAQQTPTDVISFLVTNQSVPTGDFEKDSAAAAATRDTIVRALLVNLTSLPLPSSSSGFIYRLNPTLGTMERVSDSFGSFFVERALTSGAGRVSFGMSATTAQFDRLDGQHLDDGSLVTIANQFRDESAPFDVERLTLEVESSSLELFGTFGLTDWIEIGGVVPLTRVHVEGVRRNVYYGDELLQASGVGDASGIGDVALRAKMTVARARQGGVAIAGEWRLPTGNEANLLGSGRTAIRVLAIASLEHGRAGLHGNAGIGWGGASDEIDASGAATFAVAPRVTIAGELMIRRLSDLHEIVSVAAPHPRFNGVDTFRLVQGTNATLLSTVVAGLKWNVGSTFVLGGHVAWPTSSGGLTAPITPTVSLDYLF